MNFHEIRFPIAISLGSSGGPERRTDIVTLSSGFEERNSIWANSRRRYDAGYGVKGVDDLHAVIGFFEARAGRLHGFRWKDWADFKSVAPTLTTSATDQALGTGDGSTTAFQLVKRYTSGSQNYDRTITKPVAGTVKVAIDAVVKTEGVDFTFDATTGIVTFTTAPALAEVLTAGFEFDVPVRFDTDQLDINLSQFEAGMIPNISIIEVRI